MQAAAAAAARERRRQQLPVLGSSSAAAEPPRAPPPHLVLQPVKLGLDARVGRGAQQHKLAAAVDRAPARVRNQVRACGGAQHGRVGVAS